MNFDYEEEVQIEQPRKEKAPIISYIVSGILALLGLIFMVIGTFFHKRILEFEGSVFGSEAIGELVGYVLASLLFLVPAILVLRMKNKAKKGFALILCSFIFTFVNFVSLSHQVGEFKRYNAQLDAFKVAIKEISKVATQNKVSSEISKKVYSKEEYGESYIYLTKIRNSIVVRVNIALEIQENVNNLDLESIEKIVNDQAFYTKNIETMKKLKILYSKQIESYRELIKEFKDMSQKLNDTPFRRGFIYGMEESHQKSKDLMEEFTANEILLLNSLTKRVNYIKNNKDKYDIEDGTMVFHEQKDLDEYNSIEQQFEKYSKIEDELLNKINSLRQKAVQELNKMY